MSQIGAPVALGSIYQTPADPALQTNEHEIQEKQKSECNIMYIGEASKLSGATIKAIRLYEKLGLLPNVARENSYRVFTDEDILLIKFIKIAQNVGFKLSELKQIIYPKDGMVSWEDIRHEIDSKANNIAKEIIRLQNDKKQLSNYKNEITECLKNYQDCIFPHIKSDA
ncbi:MAG: MerR family transcriptional regulator [Gammaproteobacteria bacterium]|nr:MerR family transcriptional regulator [Gammaproteobacteria bacterium]